MCNKILSKNPFVLNYCSDKYITQKMCGEAVDYFLPTLNFVPVFVTNISKLIKSFLLLCMQMKMYSVLMKFLVMLFLIVMKWAFLI